MIDSIPPLPQNDSEPLVSVIVPTYEDADRIDAALESIAAQTYGNVEVVIVDSSGVERLAALASGRERLRYRYQEPSGISAARNTGIDAATGDVIAFLDADDRWHPEKLARQVPIVESGADVVYSDVYVVENGTERRLSALPVRDPDAHHVEFLYEGGVPLLSVIVRRDCLAEERFDEDLTHAEDRNLLARLFRRYEARRVAEPLAYYTRREGSLTSDVEEMYENERRSIDRLAARFEELGPHRRPLALKARYKYGKRLLRAGRGRAARRPLADALWGGLRDPRAVSLFLVSLLPFGHRSALTSLERLQERLRTRSVGGD